MSVADTQINFCLLFSSWLVVYFSSLVSSLTFIILTSHLFLPLLHLPPFSSSSSSSSFSFYEHILGAFSSTSSAFYGRLQEVAGNYTTLKSSGAGGETFGGIQRQLGDAKKRYIIDHLHTVVSYSHSPNSSTYLT